MSTWTGRLEPHQLAAPPHELDDYRDRPRSLSPPTVRFSDEDEYAYRDLYAGDAYLRAGHAQPCTHLGLHLRRRWEWMTL